MKRINTYKYFWTIAIICAFLACLDIISKEDVDINIHDTYFVVPHSYFSVFFTLFYFFNGLVYVLCRRLKLIRILTLIHAIVTIGGFLAYFLLIAIINKLQNLDNLFDTYEIFGISTLIISILVAIAQLVFIINIITGIIKRIRKR